MHWELFVFLEIDQLKFFYHLPGPKVKCVSEYIFFVSTNKHTNKKQWKLKKKREKQKKSRKKRGKKIVDGICGKSKRMMNLFVNLLFVLLIYMIELSISPGCWYEFKVVYMQQDNSQHCLYYSNIRSTHFEERK